VNEKAYFPWAISIMVPLIYHYRLEGKANDALNLHEYELQVIRFHIMFHIEIVL